MEGPTSLIPITEIIRLVSIVRKFDCLFIKSEDFPLEFSTRAVSVVLHPEHLKLLEQDALFITPTILTADQADAARKDWIVSMLNTGPTITSCQTTILATKAYMNLILQILCSTFAQTVHIENGNVADFTPLELNLKSDLELSSNSGARKATITSLKNALNHELIIAIACLSIATGSLGCTFCAMGIYESAALQFQKAASMWSYYCCGLHDDDNKIYSCKDTLHIEEAKPIPVSIGVAEAMSILNLAYAQQMSVASTLCNDARISKNQSTTVGFHDNHLIAKLTLGIAEQIEQVLNKVFRYEDELKEEKTLVDKNCIQLLQLEKQLQNVLSKYFLACAVWEDNRGHTFASTLMKEVEEELCHGQLFSSCAVDRSSSLQYNHSFFLQDIASFKAHVRKTHCIWQQYLNKNYSNAGGQKSDIPSTMKLQSGIILCTEPDPYNILEDLSSPSSAENLNEKISSGGTSIPPTSESLIRSKSPNCNTATIEIIATSPDSPNEFKHEKKRRMMLKSFRMAFGHTGGKTLMHGLLHVKVLRATNLDIVPGLHRVMRCVPTFIINRSISGLYVTVYAGNHRLAKTSASSRADLINPVWNENFYVPVAHYISELTVSVKVRMSVGRFLIGSAVIPVGEVVRFDDTTQTQVRVSVHKVGVLSTGGRFEFILEFTPNDFSCSVTSDLAVPGVYFQSRNGNSLNMYVNADDGVGMAPEVCYGGLHDNEKIWQPPRLWRNIYDSICDAKYFIYMTGWAIDTTQSLLRGKEREQALAEGKYSPIIGELLKQKADEGVTVNLLFWDDMTSNFNLFSPVEGILHTHDEISKAFFQNSKVTFRLAPMLGGAENVLMEKITKSLLFTHHQKIIVLDAEVSSTNGSEEYGTREPLAFVGGIDLTDGRWDNKKHSLFRTLHTDHKDDFYNGCVPLVVPDVGPRQPWHDIHCSIRGPAVLDVIANFEERWYKQASNAINQLVDLKKLGLDDPPHHNSAEAWCCQVLRSIDERTACFHKIQKAKYRNSSLRLGFRSAGREKISESRKNVKEAWKNLRSYGDPFRSTGMPSSGDETMFTNVLCKKKGRYVDTSMHTGYVHLIRQARHTLYIETQYFLGSSHLWTRHSGTRCGNLIPTEITLKICEKIHRGERFTCYIVLPLWPEGIPESSTVQAMLHWQKLTMESMYKQIAETLKRKGRLSESVKDYLNFYALAKKENVPDDNIAHTANSSHGMNTPLPRRTGRHLIYVHSKLLIVDDAVAVIGSANINQRSMDGARDSEIGIASYQASHLPTETSVPHGDVHGFRLHCWATITNTMEELFKEPSSIDCVRRINEIAEENWETFISSHQVEMDSHLIPYPIVIDGDGNVSARSVNGEGFFPDTKAPILGTFTYSFPLPDLLTT